MAVSSCIIAHKAIRTGVACVNIIGSRSMTNSIIQKVYTIVDNLGLNAKALGMT